jgi:uncharacterized protein DUF6361
MSTSSFTWLDYSEQERRRMMDVVSLLAEPDTVDELGLGNVRDAIADLLFPGTSTIQRGARYFLFVPWIYRSLERRRVPSAEIAQRARKAEVALIEALLASGESERVIGQLARSRLKRLPSNIYWQGMREWRICLFSGSQDQYHRSLDTFYRSAETYEHSRNDDGERSAGSRTANWHQGLPEAPNDFPTGAHLQLSREEAHYLRDRILTAHPRSMLSELVNRVSPLPDCSFPWEASGVDRMPAKIREILHHAQCFSQGMHGAALLYNFILAEQIGNQDWVATYRNGFTAWAAEFERERTTMLGWDRARRFWEIVAESSPAHPRTKQFVNDWLDLLFSGAANTLSDNKRARDMICAREIALKGKLARVTDRRSLERWHGASGASRLSYRWRNVQAVVSDILTSIQARDRNA